MSYNSGVIVLVISNQPRATRSADLKSLARLLPELYSTQCHYHYLLCKPSREVGTAGLPNSLVIVNPETTLIRTPVFRNYLV